MESQPHARAAIATILGLIFIPWFITDPHWRNVLLGFVGLYVLYVMTEREEMLQPGKKAILITGCDHGLGHGMAKYFDRQGFRVFAGCLTAEGEGAKSLESSCSDRLKILQLNVTSDEEVEEAVTVVKGDLDGEGLWGLVNNAGVINFAEVELCPLKVFQQNFDVNCLGQIRMVKAFLPLIKRSKGRIVNFSSVCARFYMTMQSSYSLTKAGIELFSDVLRLEMIKWGVGVSTIFPSAFATNMSKWSDREQNFFDDIKRNLSKSQQTYYTDVYFKKVIERFQERAKSASQDLSPVYLAVDDALLSQTPKARYNVGQGCSLMMALMNCLPSSLLDVILTESPNTYLEKDIEPPVNMKFE